MFLSNYNMDKMDNEILAHMFNNNWNDKNELFMIQLIPP